MDRAQNRVVGIVATATATISVSVAAAGAGTKPEPKADLKFTIFKPHLGQPAYAVVGTDGVLEPVEVEVCLGIGSHTERTRSSRLRRLPGRSANR